MNSRYGLNGHQVLELIAQSLHPYKKKLEFDTKRELSNRNKILHVIRRMTGREIFDSAWNYVRLRKVTKICGQQDGKKGGKKDFSKTVFMYCMDGKKPKKSYDIPVYIFLRNTCHCNCRQFRSQLKKKRHVSVCSHLLAIILANALDIFCEKNKFLNKDTLKLLVHARMKNYKFNKWNFHLITTGKIKSKSASIMKPRPRKRPRMKVF